MIEINPVDEEDLRWWATGSYEGDMGRRSIQGGIQDALERGAICQMGAKDGGITDRAMGAAHRLRRIRARIYACTFTQSAVLQATFSRRPREKRAGDRGLATEKIWPLVTQAPSLVSAVMETWRTDETRGERSLSSWLQHLDSVSQASTMAKGRRAAKYAAAIREAAEAVLADALTAYQSEPSRHGDGQTGTFGIREIARAMGVSPTTASARLVAANVPRRGRMGPKGIHFRVRMSELRERAPDIANALTGSGSERVPERGLAKVSNL